MSIAILIAIPVVLASIMFAIYRSRLPNWLKLGAIVVLAVPLVRVVIAMIGIFQ